MMSKQGKLYIDGKLMSNRYDRNEEYGVNMGDQSVEFLEITNEIFIDSPKSIFDKYKLAIQILKALEVNDNYKITISRPVNLKQSQDFMRLAFDPPTEIIDAEGK